MLILIHDFRHVCWECGVVDGGGGDGDGDGDGDVKNPHQSGVEDAVRVQMGDSGEDKVLPRKRGWGGVCVCGLEGWRPCQYIIPEVHNSVFRVRDFVLLYCSVWRVS